MNSVELSTQRCSQKEAIQGDLLGLEAARDKFEKGSEGWKRLNDARMAYGEYGVDNNVDVIFDNEIGRPAQTLVEDGRIVVRLNVEGSGGFGEMFRGGTAWVERVATVAHEGKHVHDLKLGRRDYDKMEFEGYYTQSFVNEAFGVASQYGYNSNTTLWYPGIRKEAREFAANFWARRSRASVRRR